METKIYKLGLIVVLVQIEKKQKIKLCITNPSV